MLDKALAKRIKIRLIDKGISQRWVSKATGICERDISLIFCGKLVPNEIQQVKICGALGETNIKKIFK